MRVRDARILELEHELDLEKEANAPGKAALAKLAMIPPLGVSSERGRPVPPPTRKAAMHMMSYMTPPSGVVPNIIAVLLYFAPFLLSDIHLPTISCVRSIREEMLFISQTLSANKIGFAKRVKQLCHDGGDIGGIAGVTVSEHITNADGRDETVILEALASQWGRQPSLSTQLLRRHWQSSRPTLASGRKSSVRMVAVSSRRRRTSDFTRSNTVEQ